MTQVEFYDLCKVAEFHRGTGVNSFALGDQGEKKAAIKRIEREGPREAEVPIILSVLGLPETFLSDVEGHPLAVAVGAAEQFWAEGHYSLPALPGPNNGRRARNIAGFQRVFGADMRPVYRTDAFRDLEELVCLSIRRDPVLFVLEGRKGVGKTFLVSQWYWPMRDVFPNAFRINCAGKSLDQIFPLAQLHFELTRRVPAARGSGCLLFIDGLQSERNAGGVHIRLPGRLAHIDEVIETVNRVFHGIGELAVILAIENNQPALSGGEVFDKLAPQAGYFLHRLKPLDEVAGAAFLAENGLAEVGEPDRRKLSVGLQGMPIALRSAALKLQYMDRHDREEYLAGLTPLNAGRKFRAGSGPHPESPRDAENFPDSFNDLFEGWLGQLGNDDVDHRGGADDPRRAHPHAVLRLLAILSGPVTHDELEEIITTCPVDIPRLSNRTIDFLKLEELPFVLYIDDRYDLHMLVRQALREELDQCVDSGEFDCFTNREQLEAIHWTVARMQQETLSREKHPDANCVGIIESFVYHMVQQIRLIPRTAANRRMVRPVRGYSKEDLKKLEAGPGKLANGKLWWLAFYDARRFLVDSQKTSTRVHGQFEAKARILAHLMAVAEKERIAIELNHIDVPREIAICWMHAGRLQLALKAIGRARPQAHLDPSREEEWLRACDQASVEIAVRMRLGRSTLELENMLKPFLAAATSLALQATPSTKETERMPKRYRGALRILCRAAEVAQSSGKEPASLARFDQALQLRACWQPRLFTGESARHLVVGLVRSRRDQLERARGLVQENIALYEAYSTEEPRKGSNDIVGFLVLNVALSRIAGDLQLARRQLLEVEDYPFVRRREITFSTRAELELESLRLNLVGGTDRIELLQAARSLSDRLKAAEHRQLYFAAEVLVGESLEGHDRATHCDRLQRELSRGNVRMRERDVELLREGTSPTQALGL